MPDSEAVVRRYLDTVFSPGKEDLSAAIAATTTEDFVAHMPPSQGPDLDRSAYAAWVAEALATFDAQVEEKLLGIDGDTAYGRVACTLTAKEGGATTSFMALFILELRDGRVAADWTASDTLQTAQDLGMVPATASGAIVQET